MLKAALLSGFFISPNYSVNHADFLWNIGSGPTENYSPNVLSELEYSDLEFQGAGIDIGYSKKLTSGIGFYSEIKYSDSDLKSGTVRDSDWAGDNRTDEFSRSTSDANDDGLKNLSIALGMKFRIFDHKDHYITFLVGKDETKLDLVSTNGVQNIWRPELIGAAPSDFGPGDELVGLNSSYDVEFDSYWLGFKTDHFFSWGIISLRYQNFDIDYDAKANWNLRDDFAHPVSFTHKSDGRGHDIELGYTYVISKHWDIYSNFRYRKWEIDAGYDQTFFADGQSAILRFNEAELESKSLTVGFRYYL